MSSKGVERIHAVFGGLLDEGWHSGAQLVVLRDGKLVVDVADGVAQRRTGLLVDVRTPFLVFSVTKSFTAACIHHLVELGLIALDEPVAEVWPEFGCRGKQAITVRHVLLHQAGLPTRRLLAQMRRASDWEAEVKLITDLAVQYPPGSKTGYHALSYGFILGEVVRRVTGMPIRQYLAQTFFKPLGLKDTALGLPEIWRRRASGVYFEHLQQAPSVWLYGSDRMRAAEIPAGSLHSSARDLAVFFQMLANQGSYAGRQFLQPETVAQATRLYYDGIDSSMHSPMHWALGFHLGGSLSVQGQAAIQPFGEGSQLSTFGHAGQASCIVWADQVQRLVFAFTCNGLVHSRAARQRWKRLADAVWAALE